MDRRDQVFLQDVVDLVVVNRVVAAHALQQAWSNAEEGAVWAVAALHSQRHVDQLTPAVLKAVREQQVVPEDTLRVRRTLLGKIFVEMMAGYEDFAAFCFAIQEHNQELAGQVGGTIQQPPKGIFRRFLESRTQDVRRYVYRVHQLKISSQSVITVEHPQLLAAPATSTFPATMPQDQADAVRKYYADLPSDLAQILGQYIQAEDALGIPQPQTQGLQPSWDQDLNILMDILPRGQAPRPEILIRAFNKLKHRFMVTERLDHYDVSGVQQGLNPTQIEYGRLPIGEKYMLMFVQNAVSTAYTMGAIARMLIMLNEAGVPL